MAEPPTSPPKKNEVRVHQARNPKTGRGKKKKKTKPLRSLSNELYIYVFFFLKKKSSNANSTHLNKKAPPWASPALLLLAGALGAPGRGRRLDGTVPTCSVVWHTRGSVGGLAQESGPRSDSAPRSRVRNSPATGGVGGSPRLGAIGTAAQPGPRTAASIKEGKRKSNGGDARSCGVLFTLRRTPTSPASGGESGLKSRWHKKNPTA